jgi:4-hydroxymandelate oxidase
MTRREALVACAVAGAAVLAVPLARRSMAQQTAATATSIPAEAVSLSDFEALAQQRLAPEAYAYVSGGAADELTLRWNREALDRLRLRPRVLVDVAQIDTRLLLFGQQLAFPILLAPTALHRVIHPEGEVETARGAGKSGAVMVISTFATFPVEEIARVATPPPWFQLYVQTDRAFTRELVQRAEDAGCRVLCVTVDTPVAGTRNRQARTPFKTLPHVPNFKGGSMDRRLTWNDIEWIRSFARVPVVLKGILEPDDAEHAVREGVAGLIVSNHGGRNLDTLPATIDALPAVAEKVAGRVPLLMDSGIRRGTDIVKALALGAAAVLIGRPSLHGLAVAGAEGVHRVLTILRQELELAMALTGRPALASIDRSVLW